MKISVIGAGYVGFVTGACLAEKGHDVLCVDVRKEAVESINSGLAAIHEPGLEGILKKNAGRRLKATTDLPAAVRDTELSFLCVGTPSAHDGAIDLSFIRAASRDVGKALKAKGGARHVVVVKSTVVPGTAMSVAVPEIEAASGLKFPAGFGVGSNPEFLREGNAVDDFMYPDRIVIGADDEDTRRAVGRVYEGKFEAPVVFTNTRTAEMIKYANNALYATLISFSNEIADICEAVPGVDVDEVLRAVTMDARVNPKAKDGSFSNPHVITYLRAGCGFGGSCFPKDVAALSDFAGKMGRRAGILEAVVAINRARPARIVARLKASEGALRGRKVAVLGTAFKPDTDDIRESPAIALIGLLLAEGAEVVATDPQALENTKKAFGAKIAYAQDAREALRGAGIAILATKWKEFAALTPEDFRRLMAGGALLFDGRRFYDRKEYSAAVRYEGIGLGAGADG